MNYHRGVEYEWVVEGSQRSLPDRLAVGGVHQAVHHAVDRVNDQWDAGQAHQGGNRLQHGHRSSTEQCFGSPGDPEKEHVYNILRSTIPFIFSFFTTKY